MTIPYTPQKDESPIFNPNAVQAEQEIYVPIQPTAPVIPVVPEQDIYVPIQPTAPVIPVVPEQNIYVPSPAPSIPVAANVTQPYVHAATIVSQPEQATVVTETGTAAHKKKKPPPGIAEGGVWGEATHIGKETCILTTITCCFIGGFGLLCLALPRDTKKAYLLKNNVYDKKGRYMGTKRDAKFKSKH